MPQRPERKKAYMREYMRDYMRRRRAATRLPKAAASVPPPLPDAPLPAAARAPKPQRPDRAAIKADTKRLAAIWRI